MRSKLLARISVAGIAVAAIAGTTAILWEPWASSTPSVASACGATYASVLDPAHFVPVVDNPYGQRVARSVQDLGLHGGPFVAPGGPF